MGLVGVSLAAAWGLSDAYNSVGEIRRFYVPDDVLTEPEDRSSSEPRNILLIGSTENEGIEPGSAILEGREDVALADTIMVLRVEPAAGKALLLTINRDIRVPEGPWGYQGMINGAYDGRDPSTLIRVIRDYIGIEINDFIKVNFAGFQEVIDEMDGVPVYFEHPMRDEGSFFATDAGCHVLDGEEALSYVRSRKMQVDLGKGFVKADGWSDLDRTTRQRDFLVLAAQRAIDKGADDPRVLRSMIDAVNASGAVVLDQHLTPDDLIDISRAFDGFSPETLQSYGIGTVPDPRNPNRLVIDEQTTAPLVDLFNGRTDTTPNDYVNVVVEEARAPDGRVGDAAPPAEELRDVGFRVKPTTARQADRRDRTTITYSPDQALAALTLARNLATHPAFEPVPGRSTLTLHVGSDWTGLTLVPLPAEDFAGEIASAPSPATTTTTAPDDGAAVTSTTTAPGASGSAVIGADPAGGLCEPD
jgi:LCP family protein required for cell wall assembly